MAAWPHEHISHVAVVAGGVYHMSRHAPLTAVKTALQFTRQFETKLPNSCIAERIGSFIAPYNHIKSHLLHLTGCINRRSRKLNS